MSMFGLSKTQPPTSYNCNIDGFRHVHVKGNTLVARNDWTCIEHVLKNLLGSVRSSDKVQSLCNSQCYELNQSHKRYRINEHLIHNSWSKLLKKEVDEKPN